MVHPESRDQSYISAGPGLDRTKIANFATTVAAKNVDTLHRFYSNHTLSHSAVPLPQYHIVAWYVSLGKM